MRVEIISKGVFAAKGKELKGVHEFDREQALRLIALGKAKAVDADFVLTTEVENATTETVATLQDELDKANKTNAALNNELLKEQQSNKELSDALKAAKKAAQDIEKKYEALTAKQETGKKTTTSKTGSK